MSVVVLPESLRAKLGEDGARDLAELFNVAGRNQRQRTVEVLGERFERRLTEAKAELELRIAEVEARLERRITEVKAELERRIAEVKADLEARMAQLEARIERRLAETRADMIKWMFIFWIGQVAATAGIVSILVRR